MVDIGLRITFTTGVALALFVFVFFWETGSMSVLGPYWLGTLLYVPILAYLLSFCLLLVIQKMSCEKLDAGAQATNALYLPMYYYLMLLILVILPGLRNPVEGVAGYANPQIRRAISSGFYVVLTTYLAQEMANKAAMSCP